MGRTVIRTLVACEPVSGEQVQIQPGTSIAGCRIRRNSIPGEVYAVEFELTGRRYQCALAQFLPRTMAISHTAVEEKTARDSVAV